ncbi:MAG TPA: response regulator [Vicinamibacterales bacterium]|nr:response regulator [Vicinamibacterales bacterium]
MLSPKLHPRTVDPKSRLPAPTPRLPAPRWDTRILIVDQDRQLGVTLSFMLATRQFDDVRSVRSAKRAMGIAEQFLPDMIFLDLDLPDGGAIPLGRLLARDARGRRRPRLIGLTNHSEDPNRDEARAAGFERLLVKPVSHEELDKILGISKTAA